MAMKNKLGISDSAELAKMEEQISKKKLWNCLRAALYLQAAVQSIEKMPQSDFDVTFHTAADTPLPGCVRT